ncbi:aspartate--tRNA ligase msd1 [Marasmius crinis-equi]|uniref:Aspartate--tRNA ligase msd1 n=1 Tax=Marasmius crinis-equi TaxID=585013 RepID=A0ABR3FYY4_9AGAR
MRALLPVVRAPRAHFSRLYLSRCVAFPNFYHSSPKLRSQDSQEPPNHPSRLVAHSAPFPARTHTCGTLSARDAGSCVVLAGWLLPERSPSRKGKLVSFFPLKDSTGTVQLILDRSEAASELQPFRDIPPESSVLVQGTVHVRPSTARRPGPTGEIDVQVERFILLNPADPAMPFLPSNPHNLPNEELRLRYRYLDLRRSTLTENLAKRSKVARLVRNLLHEHNFVEVETPILLRSSVEGAREYLVPTRTNVNSTSPSFYALQQSPQQPKQLLVASGAVDRYYQIAKCFRDEDGRKDRQPEFTQIDLEMAYVSWGSEDSNQDTNSPWSHEWRIGGGQVRDVVESIIKKIWTEVENVELPHQFQTMTYHEAMSRFGSDKPDTRFGLQVTDVTKHLPPELQASFQRSDEILECIVVSPSRSPEFVAASRKCERDPAVEGTQERFTFTEQNSSHWLLRSKSVGWVSPDPSGLGPGINIAPVNERLNLEPGDFVWLARRSKTPKGGSTALGRQRLQLLEHALAAGNLSLPEDPHFLWITEFPLFTRSDDDKEFLAKGRWTSSHHPFTAPMWQDVGALFEGRVEAVRGQHYDLVLNGVEIGGGSVRVHDASMQDHIFTNILQV